MTELQSRLASVLDASLTSGELAEALAKVTVQCAEIPFVRELRESKASLHASSPQAGPCQAILEKSDKAIDSPFHVPEDFGTPVGPHLTPGKPLGFLTLGTPEPSYQNDGGDDADAGGYIPSPGSSVRMNVRDAIFFSPDSFGDADIPTLEAVEPIIPGTFSHDACVPGAEPVPDEFDSYASAWEKRSAALKAKSPVRGGIPKAARQMSAQAHKAKGKVSEKVHRSIGYVKEHAEGAKRMPVQTVHRSLEVKDRLSLEMKDRIQYVKDHTESALKAGSSVVKTPSQVPVKISETAHKGLGYAKAVPAQMSENAHKGFGYAKAVPVQMSENAHKGFGYAKEKAGNAREKAHTVSAAVTARVTQTTQKGFDMAKGMTQAKRAQPGGA